MVTKEELIEMNRIASGVGKVLKENELESCLSSYYYYDTVMEQIASIYRGLVKNHSFVDGNKRTATLFLRVMLSKQFNIQLKDDIKTTGALAIDIASNHFDIPKIVEKILDIIP